MPAAELHEWICTDDEYSRLLVPANGTNSNDIVRVTGQAVLRDLVTLMLITLITCKVVKNHSVICCCWAGEIRQKANQK